MANGEEEEEAELEQQLELQLEEQRDSLNALNEALASDPSNSELLFFQEELIVAIRDSEDGLLHLKRSRLLRETDSILSLAAEASGCGFNGNDVKVEALDPQLEAENYGVGSKCRWDWFRYNRYDPHFSENGGGVASGGANLKRLPRGQAEDEDEEEAEEVVAEMEKPCFGVGGDEHRNLESEFGYCVKKNLQFPC